MIAHGLLLRPGFPGGHCIKYFLTLTVRSFLGTGEDQLLFKSEIQNVITLSQVFIRDRSYFFLERSYAIDYLILFASTIGDEDPVGKEFAIFNFKNGS